MGRKYINILVLIGITQLMQCTVLNRGLYMDNCIKQYQDSLNRNAEGVHQAHQDGIKIFCVDFYTLFKGQKKV
ncbi:hypothetical protein [Cardinium endosymbiont of Sogatella furcifera]|uniref:hypothetical protein n=1 Tax=Cardinium endosymbiont of Sogatella furcifera TaxID=650378 RepID=UPI0013B441BD|nr:hypothetical protein [Cardinium endosymbiont of Sogatella furcifera]